MGTKFMLHDCHILVVEDEFALARQMQLELSHAGAAILGPEPSVDRALIRIRDEPRIDVAVLDVNLKGEKVFPVAEALIARQVPFLFMTGYEDRVVHTHYPHAIKCDKPANFRNLVAALERLIA